MKVIHVVAAVIFDKQQQHVLVSKRHDHAHQGGLWEFPGGKVETGESAQQALQREIKEEIDLGIDVGALFHCEQHQYPDKHVNIDFFCVHDFVGQPTSLEAQLIEWVPIVDLPQRDFPAANAPVIEKLINAFAI